MAALRLLHTADMHNRLKPAAAQRLDQLRRENDALLFDSGDAVGAANITVRRAEPIIDLMNEAGYTAMAIGNREYFFRKGGMIHKTQAAKFAVLTANLQALDGNLGHIEPWIIVTTPTVGRVGIFGLTRTMIRPASWVELFSNMRFVPWKQATHRVVSALDGQVDWLVALSHLGEEQNQELVQTFPQIDMVLGGHNHPQTTQIRRVSRRLICQPVPYAREAVLITIFKAQGHNSYESSVIELP